jgi:hypothetical protein
MGGALVTRKLYRRKATTATLPERQWQSPKVKLGAPAGGFALQGFAEIY